MSEPVLQFERVSKSFGPQTVLDGLRLVIDPGEFFALVGVNGAGKTTLIKSLLDFTAIESGAITVFGTSHTLTKARERLVFLPERFIPPYFLKGRDFLTYMSRLHGVVFGLGEVEKVLMALDLEFTALDKPVREFSKGMAQKLGLAACLLSGKELMILDEPMSGLDPKARALLKQHLLECKGHGHTLFFSTHLLSDVEALCDRMGVLHQGVLRFVGSPQECCRKYDAYTLEQAFLNCIEG